jgi:hypothetical protein
MTPRSPLIAALALALALALSACGKSQEKAAETLAEEALEANSGQKVDVDIEDDGQTVTIQTEEGTIKQTSGDNVALPAEFPTDIALPDDYKLMSVMTMGPVTSVVMEVPQSPSDLFATFKSKQADQGWKETLAMQGTDGSMLGFEKGDRSMLVNLSSSESGGTMVSLSLQSKN